MDKELMSRLTEEQLKSCPPIAIPLRLQREELRFIKLKTWEKKAFEVGWTTSATYRYDDPKLLNWMAKGGNYGVACGFGGLLIIDIDQVERMKELGILDKLNALPTYTVRTRSGGLHYYYFCPDFDKKRVMCDLTLTGEEGGKKVALHLGEMQWQGAQCVGPTSRLRTVVDEPEPQVIIQLWKEEEGRDIATVSQSQILEIFEGKVKYSKKAEKKEKAGSIALKDAKITPAPVKKINSEWAWLKDIHIEDIAMPLNVQRDDRANSGEIQGSNPLHGSESGVNFNINVKKGIWHCWRDNSGGGVLEFVAVEMGLIECGEAQKGCLRAGGLYHQVFEELRRRGYNVPPSACELKEGEIGLREHVELVMSRLAWNNAIDPQLFVYRGRLARVLGDGTIDEISRDSLPEIIDKAVRFYYYTGTKDPRRINTYPPREVVGSVLSKGDWPGLPELVAVSKAPIIRKDFSICTTPGFDAETGIYYIGDYIELPNKVSESMALESALILDRSLFGGFIFEDDASAANAWAMIFMGLLRDSFGLVPGFAISKPDVSSGASTLSTIPAYVCQGDEGAVLGKKSDRDAGREEQQKRLDAALIEGCRFIVMDNLHSVESDYYNTLLTQLWQTIRLLGHSKQKYCKNNRLLIFNGKHLSFTDDTARRMVVISLLKNAHLVFHYDLVSEIAKHRKEVLYRLLLIVRAWDQAGRPPGKKSPASLVSFRDAVSVVDSILNFVDIPDAFTNADTARDEANPQREAFETFFNQWALVLGDKGIAAEDLAEELKKLEKFLPYEIGVAVLKGDSGRVGLLLRSHTKTVYGEGLMLTNERSHGRRVWKLNIPEMVMEESKSLQNPIGTLSAPNETYRHP